MPRRDVRRVPPDDAVAPVAPPPAEVRNGGGPRPVVHDAVRRREAEMERIQSLAGLGTWELDVRAGTLRRSPELCRILGVQATPLHAGLEDLLALVHPGDRDALAALLRSAVEQGDPFATDFRLVASGGPERWVHGRAEGVLDRHGRIARVHGTVQEVTAVHVEGEALRERARLAQLAAEVTVAVGTGRSSNSMLVRCCEAVARHLDGTWASVWRWPGIGDDFVFEARAGDGPAAPGDALPFRGEEAERVLADRAPLVARRSAGPGSYLVGVPLVSNDRAVGLLAAAVGRPPSDDMLTALCGVGQQIGLGMDRNQVVADLAHQALHDPLTGLPNRMLFVDRLDVAMRRMQREDTRMAVLFVDLDRFKLVNDSYGHAAGDQVLVTIAERLTAALRPGDTVARFGGDEFTVLCEGLSADEAVLPIAERALAALETPILLEGDRETSVTASIGVALVDPGDTSVDALLADADSAMYEAKERGRNRVEVFDQIMRARVVAKAEQAVALRRAVDEGELCVHYQPDVRLGDETISGVEALVRWQHPELGLVGPEHFIGVAEETGLIVPLGAEVLAVACREVAAWHGGPGPGPLTVAVNLSARQLAEPGVIDTVRSVLDATGLDPARLCLEITESVLMEDVVSSVDALLGLRALGVKLAIDDFGTGYSSLSYLRRFPVDIVKIDRSFVSGLGVDPAAEAIVAAVVNLAHALGLVVVGEGVETEEQLVALRALGCDRAQGYLWSPPLAAADVRRWRLARTTSVVSTPVDVRAVLIERTEALRALTGRSFVLELPANLPAAQADWGAVKNVVDHLLANSVTYSAVDRPVVVSASADRRWVRLSVADFGIGMTGEEMSRCFEQFWQSEAGSLYRKGGTGMGLSSVRSLVETMGGRVNVKSAVGRGSTFTVVLPRAGRGAPRLGQPVPTPGIGEPSIVREFMRQIGVPTRREA